MQPPLWESAILGAIQGLSEFLPISSDGHLALAGLLFELSRQERALHAVLRLGTLLAATLLLRARVRALLLDGLEACVKPSLFSTRPGARDALVVVLATVPTLLIGFALRQVAARALQSPLSIGLGLLASGVVLCGAAFAKGGSAEHPGVVGALLLGVAQGLAIFPGVSRTATTVTLALWLGVSRKRAVELSVLIALPTWLGLALAEVPSVLTRTEELLPLAVGVAAAFACGLAALSVLRQSVLSGRFWWFAAWVVPVALATLALAKAWPHG